jgi:hypothetical protein
VAVATAGCAVLGVAIMMNNVVKVLNLAFRFHIEKAINDRTGSPEPQASEED